jgi:hypothetical protein
VAASAHSNNAIAIRLVILLRVVIADVLAHALTHCIFEQSIVSVQVVVRVLTDNVRFD